MDTNSINIPEVIEEIQALSEKYERALLDNDVQTLCDFFWQSPSAIRFGVAEELYGSDEIGAFRQNRKVDLKSRKPIKHTILSLGNEFAVSNFEFSITVNGAFRHGRQTQVWKRFPDAGWKIVSAHVSHNIKDIVNEPSTYQGAASALLDLPVPLEYREAVASSLAVTSKILAPLMAFELSDSVEIAPVFES